MEVGSLSDGDLRRSLLEHGITSPVTASTRNVLRSKLSKVISSESSMNGEQYPVEDVTNMVSEDVVEGSSDAYTDVVNTSTSSYVVTDGSTEYIQKVHTETSTPIRTNDDYESYSSSSYRPTPTSYRYARDSYPSADDLRRRPLNTPRVAEIERTKIERKTEVVSTVGATTTKSSKSCLRRWLCSRLFLILLVLVMFFVVLVYYHMEDNDATSLPPASPPPPVDKQPASDQAAT